MKEFTKTTIKDACEQKRKTIAEESFETGYQVTNDGDVLRVPLQVVSAKNCGCFGCDFEFEPTGNGELIGHCSDLSFLQNM